MTDPAGDRNNSDELLDKLDQLLKRHRPDEDKGSIPTLPAPVAAARDDIPVLTDAVSGPALSRPAPESQQQPDAAIENRLSAAISAEVKRLQMEMPQHARLLAALSATLSAAIRVLVQRQLARQPSADSSPGDREPRS